MPQHQSFPPIITKFATGCNVGAAASASARVKSNNTNGSQAVCFGIRFAAPQQQQQQQQQLVSTSGRLYKNTVH